MELKFWDRKVIMINKWVDEIYRKFKNPKVLEKYIMEDWQKELMNQYKELREEIKWLKGDKYMKWLTQMKADSVYEEIMKPIIWYRQDYFTDNYNSVVIDKRKEYQEKMRKKLKTEREIIPPF